MWSPTSLHNQKDEYLHHALVSKMATQPHQLIVAGGKPVNIALTSDQETAVATVQSLMNCPIAYIGTGHRQPIAPFAAFTLATPENGRLEYLIDAGSQPGDLPALKWQTHTLLGFLFALFREQSAIQKIELPLSLPTEIFDGFAIQQSAEQIVAVRLRSKT